jgi:hypothetical protein
MLLNSKKLNTKLKKATCNICLVPKLKKKLIDKTSHAAATTEAKAKEQLPFL